MNKAVIIGATGVIGTALIENLAGKGIEVLVLCRQDSPNINHIMRHPLVHLMECSMEQLSELNNPDDEAYDAFFNLAWLSPIGPGRDDPYVQNQNIHYALDAVAAAARLGCRTFIGAGSQAECGHTDAKITADTPCFPTSGYGIAKLCAGQLTRLYAHALGLRHIWPRILSVYGPNGAMLSIIPMTMDALISGQTPKLTQGEQQWDFLYSEDAAEALYLMAEKGVDGKVYPLGSGKTRLLRSYIESMRDIVAPKADLPFGSLSYHSNQIMYMCADITELQKDTGFVPKVSFEDGIRKMLKRW